MARHDVKIMLTADDRASGRLKETWKDLKTGSAESRRSFDDLNVSVDSLERKLIKLAASYLSLRTAFRAFSFGVKVAADMETAEIGLTTLLESADEAAATIERLKVEAARTPFELLGLTKATQLLTSVTRDGQESIDILLDVGESLAALGKGQAELDRIIVNMQQIAASGRAMGIDIRQFAFAGIPIYEMLAEVTGKNGEALAEFIEQGGVTFELLKQMFHEATEEGGKFAGAFVNQAGSFNQSVANMKDQFAIMMSEVVVGTGMFRALTEAVQYLTEFMVENKGVVEKLAEALIGTVKWLRENQTAVNFLAGALAILIAKITVTQTVLMGAGLVKALASLSVQLGIATAQTGLLSGALAALPLMITITVALAGFALVMTQIQQLKREIGEAAQSQFAAEDMNRRAIDRAREMREAGDEAGAQRLLDQVQRNLNVGMRAAGGPVAAGRAYIVGERGPELFVPSVGGGIVPNHALSGAGNVTINVTGNTFGPGADPEEAAREIGDRIWRQLSRMIRR